MPQYDDTVQTPVTEVTETDSGTIVVGFPPDTSTGVTDTPTIGADDGSDPQGPAQEGT